MIGKLPVWGLVLAAGLSTRMGRAKALLALPGSEETFVAHAVRVLRKGGVPNLAVVVRPSDRPLQREVERLRPPVPMVHNAAPELGQLSSLVAGLDHAEAQGADMVVVLPVDMPLVQAASVSALLEAAARHRPLIARVVHGGRHGHPVLFRRDLFDRLRTADPAAGARAVMHHCAGEVLDVPVDDPGVLRDIDRPEEYRHLFDPRAEL